MIIQLLLTLVFGIMALLMQFEVPPMPEAVFGFLERGFEFIGMGAGILANYTHLPYLISLFGLVLMVDMAVSAYKFVMWVIKKIPLLGIK